MSAHTLAVASLKPYEADSPPTIGALGNAVVLRDFGFIAW